MDEEFKEHIQVRNHDSSVQNSRFKNIPTYGYFSVEYLWVLTYLIKQKKVRQYTENLKTDEPCHLMIEERMALSKNPQFQGSGI